LLEEYRTLVRKKGGFVSHVSIKFSQISESQTVALTSLTADLIRQGKDVITLGVGEPDFDTPENIKKAGIFAIQAGRTKYTASDGLYDLKQAIGNWLEEMYNAHYSPEEIVITNGAKQAVAQAIFAVCDPGDEVIIPKPYWVSYPEQVKLAGAVPKMVHTAAENGFKITAEQLNREITSKTRMLLLNSPGNPSGAVYDIEELESLVEVARKAGIYILADEVYDQIIYDGKQFASLSSFKEFKSQLLYINGVSKSYAMTGWRIGFLAGDSAITRAVKKYQGHITSNASTISQYAAIEAYLGEKTFLPIMRAEYQKRRDYVLKRLTSFKNVSCFTPEGAFYAFSDFSAYYNRDMGLTSSVEFCKYLLKEFNVAIVPGIAFGMDDYARLSFATTLDTLEKALDRIEECLDSILKEE
jgi:aspartate aminotransferase